MKGPQWEPNKAIRLQQNEIERLLCRIEGLQIEQASAEAVASSLRAENERLEERIVALRNSIEQFVAMLSEAQEREKKLREALEFYAKAGYNAEIAKQALKGADSGGV